MGILLVQLATRVSHISKSNVILKRDTIVDLPDGFNSRRINQVSSPWRELQCWRCLSDHRPQGPLTADMLKSG